MRNFAPFAEERRHTKGYPLGFSSEAGKPEENLMMWYKNWQVVQAREREEAEKERKEKKKQVKDEDREKERGVKRKRKDEDEDAGQMHESDFGWGEAF
jgi:hypothetical protein